MEGTIKGYCILSTGRFITEDASLRQRVSKEVLAEIARQQTTIKPKDWIPRPEIMVLWRGVADAAADDAGAYSDLIRCGESIAEHATGTFLKLLLKVLTPGMFARKFPDLWAHDHQGGRIENDEIQDKSMRITIKDIEGFDHVGAAAPGFICFALKAIGLKNIVTRSPNWSRATPGPRDAPLIVTWD